MAINIESLLAESTSNICAKMGIEVPEMPPAEALRYFKFQEIPLLLFFLSKKNHRTTLVQIREQYELQTGQIIGYETIRHLVRKYYDEVERAKIMEGKARQN